MAAMHRGGWQEDQVGSRLFDLVAAREETPGSRSVLHLNNAGAALMPRPVVQAMVRHVRAEARVGSYEAADRTSHALEAVYDSAATLLGCSRAEVAVVENATRAWTLALESVPLCRGDRILIGASEYVSNCLALERVCDRTGATAEILPSDRNGGICLEGVSSLLDERVKLIALTHIPTHGGALTPVADVGRLARRAGIPFLVDACLSLGQLPVDVNELGCDFLTAAGRKYIRGPRGTGLLYVRSALFDHLVVPPIDVHGTDWLADGRYAVRKDARRFESWEVNVAAKLGLGVAIDYALAWGVASTWERVRALGEQLRHRLRALPQVQLHDAGAEPCGIVSFTVPGCDPYELRDALRNCGINVSVSDAPLTPFLPTAWSVGDLIRSSVHYYNTEAELDAFVDILKIRLSRPDQAPCGASVAGSTNPGPRPIPQPDERSRVMGPLVVEPVTVRQGPAPHVVVARGAGAAEHDGWGNEEVIADVLQVISSAGVSASEVLVETPEMVAALQRPGVFVFPNSRYFRDERGHQHSIPALLSQNGLPFLGSGPQGHAARRKSHMKAVFAERGLPTPPWLLVTDGELPQDLGELRFPLIVKPDDGSESVGVKRVDDIDGLRRELQAAGPSPMLVEEWARCREFTVAVMGNGTGRRGFPIEVVVRTEDQFLTADVKLYQLAQTPFRVADADLRRGLEELALAACAALHVDDWGRVDILEDSAGNRHVIDVNTLPGLRRRPDHISYFPLCVDYGSGLHYSETILALLAVGLLRNGIPLPSPLKATYRRLGQS